MESSNSTRLTRIFRLQLIHPKWKIWKNLSYLSLGHLLIFTAFDSLSNLQSTVNQKNGIGLVSQAIIYATFTVSSFFLPSLFIKSFGCKATLYMSIFSVCPYIAANFYPTWWTMVPSAVLCGLSFGPLWAARSTYINEISFEYSKYSSASIDVINAWFFGIHSFSHDNAEIWGNVMSYVVLNEDNDNATMSSLSNCGAEYCSRDSTVINPNLKPPVVSKWYTLTGIYLVLVAIAGFIVMVMLDPLDSDLERSRSSGSSSNLLVATVKHLRNTNQLLLVPLSFYCGLADGFYNSDFTKAFIACSWGVSYIGFVTICYGLVCATVDVSAGYLVKYLKRITVFLMAAASHFAMLLVALLVKPHTESRAMLFAMSGVYGIGASIWWSQITAYYGVIFKENEEAAFSNFYFWSSLGFSIAYSYGDSLCTATKIYILLALLLIGIIAYVIVEIKLLCNKTHTMHKLASALKKQDVS